MNNYWFFFILSNGLIKEPRTFFIGKWSNFDRYVYAQWPVNGRIGVQLVATEGEQNVTRTIIHYICAFGLSSGLFPSLQFLLRLLRCNDATIADSHSNIFLFYDHAWKSNPFPPMVLTNIQSISMQYFNKYY